MLMNVTTERNAIDHYLKNNNVGNFEYAAFDGLIAFDLFLTDNESVMLEIVCAYLDQINGINTSYPKINFVLNEKK